MKATLLPQGHCYRLVSITDPESTPNPDKPHKAPVEPAGKVSSTVNQTLTPPLSFLRVGQGGLLQGHPGSYRALEEQARYNLIVVLDMWGSAV